MVCRVYGYSVMPLVDRLTTVMHSNTTGNKALSVMKKPVDCIIGNLASTRAITFGSDQRAIVPGLDILRLADTILQVVDDKLQSLYECAVNAQAFDLSPSERAAFNSMFQAILKSIDDLLSSSVSSGNTNLFDGTMAPLVVDLPSGDSYTINIEDLRNANSPLGLADPADPKGPGASDVTTVTAAVTPGQGVEVLNLIAEQCGTDSALYIVVNKSIQIFNQGLAEYIPGNGVMVTNNTIDRFTSLTAGDWINLGLNPAAAAAIDAMVHSADFSANPGNPSVINANINLYINGADINFVMTDIIAYTLDALPAEDVTLLNADFVLNLNSSHSAELTAARVQKAIGWYTAKKQEILGQMKTLEAKRNAAMTKSAISKATAENALKADLDDIANKMAHLIDIFQFTRSSESSLSMVYRENAEKRMWHMG